MSRFVVSFVASSTMFRKSPSQLLYSSMIYKIAGAFQSGEELSSLAESIV